MAFQKATKHQLKLRSALFGPSGSGKTMSALRIAVGLGGSIAVIDTERRSASKYADRFEFDVCDLDDRTIEGYCKAIEDAGAMGYGVLIIDSLTHGWHELLGEVERIAKARYKGNTWSAWSEGTPKQRRFIEAMLAFPGHLLVTMRSKTEWVVEKDERTGKSSPKRVGAAPEQGKGIEYEFDLLIELSADHVASIIKDRTGKFQDKTIDKPDEELGRALAGWLSEGVEPPPMPEKPAEAKQAPPNGHSKWQVECGALLTSLKAGGDKRFANRTAMLAHLIDWAHTKGFDVVEEQPITVEGVGSLTEEQREKYASTLVDLLEAQKTAKAGA